MTEIRKIEIEWHESYLLVNETLGILEEEIAKLASTNAAQFLVQKYAHLAVREVSNLVTSMWFKVVMGIAAAGVVLVALPMYDIFSYDILMDYGYTRKPYIMIRELIRNTVYGLDYINMQEVNMPTAKNPSGWEEAKREIRRFQNNNYWGSTQRMGEFIQRNLVERNGGTANVVPNLARATGLWTYAWERERAGEQQLAYAWIFLMPDKAVAQETANMFLTPVRESQSKSMSVFVKNQQNLLFIVWAPTAEIADFVYTIPEGD